MKKLLAFILTASLFAPMTIAQTPVPAKKDTVKKTAVRKSHKTAKKTVVTRKRTVTTKES